jgi:hypothetical protein
MIYGETEAERESLDHYGATALMRDSMAADLRRRRPDLFSPLRVWWKRRTDGVTAWDLVQLREPIGEDGALSDVVHVHATIQRMAHDGPVPVFEAIDHDRRARQRRIAYLSAGALAAAVAVGVLLGG